MGASAQLQSPEHEVARPDLDADTVHLRPPAAGPAVRHEQPAGGWSRDGEGEPSGLVERDPRVDRLQVCVTLFEVAQVLASVEMSVRGQRSAFQSFSTGRDGLVRVERAWGSQALSKMAVARGIGPARSVYPFASEAKPA